MLFVASDWKTIPEFPAYEVHSHGLVHHPEDGRTMRSFVGPEAPYLRVHLIKDGAQHEVCVLPIVEALFHQNKEK